MAEALPPRRGTWWARMCSYPRQQQYRRLGLCRGSALCAAAVLLAMLAAAYRVVPVAVVTPLASAVFGFQAHWARLDASAT